MFKMSSVPSTQMTRVGLSRDRLTVLWKDMARLLRQPLLGAALT